jgi:hypothetical protein
MLMIKKYEIMIIIKSNKTQIRDAQFDKYSRVIQHCKFTIYSIAIDERNNEAQIRATQINNNIRVTQMVNLILFSLQTENNITINKLKYDSSIYFKNIITTGELLSYTKIKFCKKYKIQPFLKLLTFFNNNDIIQNRTIQNVKFCTNISKMTKINEFCLWNKMNIYYRRGPG